MLKMLCSQETMVRKNRDKEEMFISPLHTVPTRPVYFIDFYFEVTLLGTTRRKEYC